MQIKNRNFCEKSAKKVVKASNYGLLLDMKRAYITILIAILFGTGCIWLPAGDPPKGPIVTPTGSLKQQYSLDNGINYMVNEFTNGCFFNNVLAGSNIYIKAENQQEKFLAQSVIKKSGSFIGFRLVTNPELANYILSSQLVTNGDDETSWSLCLTSASQSEVWQEEIILTPQPIGQ